MSEVIHGEQSDNVLLALVQKFVDEKNKHEELKKEASTIYKKKEDLMQQVWDMMETLDIKSVLGAFGLVSRTTLVIAKIEDEAAFRKHVEEGNMEDIGVADIYKTIPEHEARDDKRITELVRDLLSGGKNLPPGLDFVPIKKMSVRKK